MNPEAVVARLGHQTNDPPRIRCAGTREGRSSDAETRAPVGRGKSPTRVTWDDPLQSPYFGGRSSAFEEPDPKPGPGPTSRSRWAKCGVVLLYVIGLHNLASSVVKCSSSRNPFEVLDAVSVACRTFFSAVTTHLFYRGYPCVATFLSLERGADLALSHQRQMKLKHGAARGFVVAYGVAMMVHQVVWLSHYGAAAYIRTQVYSLDVSALEINGFLAAVLAYLDFTAFHASVFVPALCILQYVLVCDMVVLKVKHFRSLVRVCTKNSDVQAGPVKRLHSIYTSLWNAVQKLDSQLSLAVFLWYVDLVLNIIISVRMVQHTLSQFNPYSAAGAYVQALYLGLMFLLMSYTAANLIVEVRHVDHDVCQLVCALTAIDGQTCNQVMLLQEEVANCRMAFTGWNCFNIDRSFILTVIGAIITYAVVLQQLT
ncbi:unnamed protein product [Ixodes persulcatus]